MLVTVQTLSGDAVFKQDLDAQVTVGELRERLWVESVPGALCSIILASSGTSVALDTDIIEAIAGTTSPVLTLVTSCLCFEGFWKLVHPENPPYHGPCERPSVFDRNTQAVFILRDVGDGQLRLYTYDGDYFPTFDANVTELAHEHSLTIVDDELVWTSARGQVKRFLSFSGDAEGKEIVGQIIDNRNASKLPFRMVRHPDESEMLASLQQKDASSMSEDDLRLKMLLEASASASNLSFPLPERTRLQVYCDNGKGHLRDVFVVEGATGARVRRAIAATSEGTGFTESKQADDLYTASRYAKGIWFNTVGPDLLRSSETISPSTRRVWFGCRSMNASKDPEVLRREVEESRARGTYKYDFGGGSDSSCFLEKSVFRVLRNQDGTKSEQTCQMKELRAGDLVCTGSSAPGDMYRRITKIWPTRISAGKLVPVVDLGQGCYVTSNHPVWSSGSSKWVQAGVASSVTMQSERVVYGLELEGHVDTVLVGSTVCAAIGVYCGANFAAGGWNVFTRRTTYCDKRLSGTPCKKCALAVDESLDFASITTADLEVRYCPLPL